MPGDIEELNIIGRSIPFKDYFSEMDLTDEEKKDRIKLAEEFKILFLFLFLHYKKEQSKELASMLQMKYKDISMAFLGKDKATAYIEEYSKQLIEEIVRVTNENLKDPYYTSADRATFIAENEANAIGGYRQHIEAIKSGKKYKTWITMNDKKVRHTHREVDNLKIPIFEPFQVGKSEMMFPTDQSLGAKLEEIVGCRCVLEYS